MAKLIYSMLSSLDGYTEDASGQFAWGAPQDAELHTYVNTLAAPLGTYLYGRKMYEVMVYWETAHLQPDLSDVEQVWTQQWQAAEKIVYSRSLGAVQSARTRIERDFDVAAVRQLKADSPHDLAIAGPELAAQAMRAGLVDEIQLIAHPVLVGGGKRFFPAGVQLDLDLLEERCFESGVVALRYAVRP